MPSIESINQLLQMVTEFQRYVARDPFALTGIDEALEKIDREYEGFRYKETRDALRLLVQAAAKDVSLDTKGTVPIAFFYRLHELFVLTEASFVVGRKLTFNDVETQVACASLYRDGERLGRNPERAAFWLSRAADQDDIFALYTLAQVYLSAPELSKALKAVYLLERATELGDDDSPTLLASLFLEGKSIDQDYRRGAHWAELAARRNSVQGQRMLGWLYAQGLGVKQDLIQALAWLTIASEAGDLGAQQLLPQVAAEAKQWQTVQVKSRVRQFKAEMGLPT